MHRVELKLGFCSSLNTSFRIVPNAPCGVETLYILPCILTNSGVPNAPCGVERSFLCIVSETFSVLVPNAPCGVETREDIQHFVVPKLVPNAPCGVET